MANSLLPEYEEDMLDQDEEELEEPAYPDTTWILNSDNKTIGALEDDRVACVAQAAKIALRVEQQEYEMYSISYGSTLNEHLGETKPHVYAEIEHSIRTCLAEDDRIESVSDFRFEDRQGDILVRFNMTVNGENIEMVMEVDTNGD